MTDNERIAQWGDWPLFNTSNPSAIEWMLETLKARNHWFALGTETDELDMLTGEYRFKIVPPQGKPVNVYAKTLAGAISSAILQLIADET